MKTIPIVGYPVVFSGLQDIVERISLSAAQGGGGYICVSNTHQLMCGHEDVLVDSALRKSFLNISDSQVLRKLAMRRDASVAQTDIFRGYDLAVEVCRAASKRGVKVGFYGGTRETLCRIVERLSHESPHVEVGYVYSPPFREMSEAELYAVYNDINASGVGILLVGLGCPKQEKWMYSARASVAPLMIGVGAAFDFMAGVNKPSPSWVHRSGLEWLYRLLLEPRRLWKRYFKYNVKFIYYYLFKPHLCDIRRD